MPDRTEAAEKRSDEDFRSGYVALLGRPNVVKSTLLNHLVGQKISITAPRPQTTRDQILGILTRPDGQLLFLDTPGVHSGYRRLNRHLLRATRGALESADLGVLVVDALLWTPDDAEALRWLQRAGIPLVAVVNKVDRVASKARLFPFVQALAARGAFAAILPLSARKATDVKRLADVLVPLLPPAPAPFPENQVTDRTLRFMAAEIIREQLFRQLGAELPYDTAVAIDSYRVEPHQQRIEATIYCRRPGQKAIILGEGGSRLRGIGSRAREALQVLTEERVWLGLWVKQREQWSEDRNILRELGYDD